jgi:hypothetical protein
MSVAAQMLAFGVSALCVMASRPRTDNLHCLWPPGSAHAAQRAGWSIRPPDPPSAGPSRARLLEPVENPAHPAFDGLDYKRAQRRSWTMRLTDPIATARSTL